MSFLQNISKYKIILASNSPRRKELLSGLDINYKIKTIPNVDESYPDSIQKTDVSLYIAKAKAAAYEQLMQDDTLLITADTVVVLNDVVYGKPKTEEEARQMLHQLSENTHIVATGVCITTKEKQCAFKVESEVRFAKLDDEEIDYYVSKYKPLDKAGSYGIQEWIGYVAVEHISGSYFNIMGLPVQRLYQELKRF